MKLKDWREMLPAVQEIYRHHGAGCCWHVVLDDHNVERENVEFCAKEAERNGCVRCMALSPLALRASYTQMAKVAASKNLSIALHS